MSCDIMICKKQSGFCIFKQQGQGVKQNGSQVKKTEKILTKIWKNLPNVRIPNSSIMQVARWN